jgi:elongation factor Ts
MSNNKVTMDLIKKLREKTQVGMMDCKQALVLADGDFDKAVEILRKKGAKVAAKRAENVTNNGRIATYIAPDYTLGTLVEVSCETDFSANTKDMQQFVETISEHLAKTPQCATVSPEALLEQKLFSDDTMTIQMLLDDLLAKISEKITVSQCARFDTKDGIVNAYIHPGATLGSIIELETKNLSDDNKEKVAQLARDICMQIAVTNPICIEPSQVDPGVVEKEKCIAREQLLSEKKPEAIIEKIIPNKLNKFYEEVCLIKQKYIKNDKISIEKHIEARAKETGTTITIKQYKRFQVGK